MDALPFFHRKVRLRKRANLSDVRLGDVALAFRNYALHVDVMSMIIE